ncbi:glycosyltransferase family 2 protein [Cellulomonas fimi]|uniref:glycosyltransferase family 2 protein n=1 Tax=Cellulomonas fimi TaxID=1708 RepID=UPI002359C542|nr:glycosyltransferase family 2 protein [Cellulomonas fimi]
MRTAAIVVAYRSESTLRACLDALASSGVDEVVVWDNSPDLPAGDVLDGTMTDVVRVATDGTNRGFGAGVNRAAALVPDADAVVLVNPDCIVDREAVRALVDGVRDPRTGVVGVRAVSPSGEPLVSGGARPSLVKETLASLGLDRLVPRRLRQRILATGVVGGGSRELGLSMQAGPPIELDWVSGCCLAVRREVFDAVGGFDEDYFLYFEDVDLCLRVRDLGFRVMLLRDVEVLHFESTSTGPAGKSTHYRRGYGTYLDRHASRLAASAARLVGVAR